MRSSPILTASLLNVSLLLSSVSAPAQTLAKPGFTANTETWWRNAVFYRIVPEHFQDSDNDGIGDLRGIAQRLNYLQELGVDAIVLQLPFDDAGFDDLFAEASRRHIRVVIELRRSPDAALENLASLASHWLARGAAGILLPALPATAASAELLKQLRRAAARLPGERVIIPEVSSIATESSDPSIRRGPAKSAAKADGPQLVLSTLPVTAAQISSAAEVAVAVTELQVGGGTPLLQLPQGGVATGKDNDAAIAAATLLTQHAAVLLEYGQELGETSPVRMPWTPSNVTPALELPPEPVKSDVPAPGSHPDVYGPYRAYVPPPPAKPKPAPPPPGSIVLPDPNSLPGFTSKADAAGADASVSSVVLQERDPRSTLSLYRRLIALHHGNPAFRDGSLTLLHGNANDPADKTVAWLRLPPAGMRTSGPAVIAVNCGDTPAELSLADDLMRVHAGRGELRSLFTGGQIEGSTRLILAPHAVFVGEFTPVR